MKEGKLWAPSEAVFRGVSFEWKNPEATGHSLKFCPVPSMGIITTIGRVGTRGHWSTLVTGRGALFTSERYHNDTHSIRMRGTHIAKIEIPTTQSPSPWAREHKECAIPLPRMLWNLLPMATHKDMSTVVIFWSTHQDLIMLCGQVVAISQQTGVKSRACPLLWMFRRTNWCDLSHPLCSTLVNSVWIVRTAFASSCLLTGYQCTLSQESLQAPASGTGSSRCVSR